MKFVQSTAFLLSGFGVYTWLRHLFSAAASLAGATVYLLYPYFWTRTLYFIGDYPQLLALLLLPVCLWALTALHNQSRARYWLAAVVALAALVFSHNLTAMLGAGALSLYWLLLAVGYRRPDGLLRCAVAALLAALLSAALWLPALADLSLVQIDNARGGICHFSRTFLLWRELFSFQSPFLDSGSGGLLKFPYTFGAASWLAGDGRAGQSAVRGAQGAPGLGPRRRPVCPGNALAHDLPVSKRLWEKIPALSFLQFPFRFLGMLRLARCWRPPWPSTPGRPVGVGCRASFWRWLLPWFSSRICFPDIHHFPPMPVKTLSPEDTRLLERTLGNWGMTDSHESLVQGADIERRHRTDSGAGCGAADMAFAPRGSRGSVRTDGADAAASALSTPAGALGDGPRLSQVQLAGWR